MKGFLIALVGLTICFSTLCAQDFGGNNPSILWNQLKNDKIKVIFPAGLEKDAKRVAEIARALNVGTRSTIGYADRSIDFILQTNTTISNGYVQLAPWKSELFLTPLQNSLELGSLPWIDLLTFHEYRHVQQYMNFRKGLSKWAWNIAGEQGQAIANSAAIPNWFFEGDAVLQETSVSEQGRGRLPYFFNDFRVLWDADRSYSFAKLRNGSYRHLVPNHYLLGYMLTAYGVQKFKPAIWEKVANDAVRFKPFFYPFQRAFEHYTNQSLIGFVGEAIGNFQVNDLYYPSDSVNALTTPSEHFVKNYHLPIVIGKDSILTLRKTDKHLPAFVLLSKKKENVIAIKDIGVDDYYTYRNGVITYSSYKPDARWNKTDYANIVSYNIKTKTKQVITSKRKFFSPDLSPSGKYIIAVEVLPEWRSSLVLLSNQGSLIKIISDERYFFSQPKFGKSDSSIFVTIRRGDGKMTLAEIETYTSTIKPLLPFSLRAIAFPSINQDSIYFTATVKGQDKLMLWNNKTKELFIAGNRHAGMYESFPDGNNGVFFSGGSAWGKMLYQFTPNATPFSLEDWEKSEKDLYLTIAPANNYKTAIADTSSTGYVIKSYIPYKNLLNIHSWRPTYTPPEIRLTVFNNNILNNVSASLFYEYNQNEGSHKVGGYGAWALAYPWILAGAEIVKNRTVIIDIRNRYLDEIDGYLGFQMPLNLTSGTYFKNLSFTSLLHGNRLNYKQPKAVIVETKNYGYIENIFRYSILSQQAKQHIYPKIGLQLSLRDRRMITSTAGNQFNGSVNTYLPGLVANHHLVINLSYQLRDTMNQYIFSNNFFGARGYEGQHLNYPQMFKWGLNYHFPLLYPEVGLGNVVYLSRIRLNIFYDQSTLKSLRTGKATDLRSTGSELYFDTKWWNQQPISFGIRYSKLLDAGKFVTPPNSNQISLVLPTDLFTN